MKLILLFMTIPLVISLVKNLFNFKKTDMVSYNEKLKETAEKNKMDIGVVKGFVILLCWLIGIYYTIFFVLASIFIDQIIFAIISFLLLIRSWKFLFKFMSIEDFKETSIFSKVFWRLIGIGYYGFLSYSIYIKW